MRVIHVAGGELYGGIERMLATLAATGSDRIQQWFAVSPAGPLYRELRAVNAHTVPLPGARASRPLSVLSARRTFSRALGDVKPDAAIFHGSWAYAMFAGAGREHAPFVVFWQHAPLVQPAWPDRWASWTRPDMLIANSRYTASVPAFSGLPPCVIHCPVAPIQPLSAPERAVARAKMGASDADVIVLMAARLEPWKGHAVLIDAARRVNCRAVKVWIAGGVQRPSEQAYFAELQRHAAADSRRSVTLLGQRDDVQTLMAIADVYCQPNSGPEPFGVSIAEAMRAGLPCVVSRSGGAVELVDDESGILVAPDDSGAVANAIDALAADTALRSRMGTAARLRAAMLTDPVACVGRLSDALNQSRTTFV